MPSSDYEFSEKITPVIVVASKSNDEEYCEEIKDALCEFIVQLREKAESKNVKIKMATYFFDDEVTGSFDELKPLEEITSDDFDYIETQKSTFDLAKVLDKLNADLSMESLFTSKVGYKCPFVLFFIDGKNKYEYTGLQNIKNNKWFQNSGKVAVLTNEYSKTTLDIFTEVVGDPECVLNIADVDYLTDSIVTVFIAAIGRIIATDSLWRGNLVREDPLIVDNEVKCDTNFEIVLKSGSVSVNKKTTIQLCQVMACLPEKAMDTAFVLTPQNGFVNVEFGTEAVCEMFIDAGETIEIANCSGREISFGLNAESLSAYVDNNNNSIKFTNSSWGDSTVRVPVSVGEKMLLKDKDRILDTNNCLLVEIKADSYENTCPGEIVWDDDGFNDCGWD